MYSAPSVKSTLLQVICGTLLPTAGKIETRGRIAALLELGSGFNPEFTGCENIYLNGMLLGLSKAEIDAKFDDIAGFADIGDFINQPIKTYSSGMALRLAFAVQSQIDPDILIVDEALAVGDAKFQAKCFDRLKQLKNNGTSILLVTHSSEQIVTHCSQAILLDKGVQVYSGEPRSVVNRYMDLVFGKDRNSIEDDNGEDENKNKISSNSGINLGNENILSYQEDSFSSRSGYNSHEYRWGDGAARILDFNITSGGKEYPAIIMTGQEVRLCFSVQFKTDLVRPIFGVTIKTKEGITVYGSNSKLVAAEETKLLGSAQSNAEIQMTFTCNLAPGDYFISLGVVTQHGEEVIPHDRRYDAIHIHVGSPQNNFFGFTDLNLRLQGKEVTL